MERLRGMINLKVLIGGVLVGVCLFSALLIFLSSARQEQPGVVAGTAVLYVIAAPSATPLIPATATAPSPTPTNAIPAAPANGIIAIGAYVQISGTGGDGLRLRSEPGLAGTVRFLAIDGEVFQVIDGGRDVDGYTWWRLQAPYDPTVQGWAVANYLVIVQNP